MDHHPPDRVRGAGLRPRVLRAPTLAVEDEDRRPPLADLRDVVRDDEVQLRLPQEAHRPLPAPRGGHGPPAPSPPLAPPTAAGRAVVASGGGGGYGGTGTGWRPSHTSRSAPSSNAA